MVFGFGFNKTKVLASAERNVKQGKLQNAIVEYEKILAEDPKDLTVMNTVGDLYARVGNSEKATEYFRKIGDAYAGEGFTVRAIAMYKKLTKQNPNAHDAVLKLGDLYTQQGLYNDARAQYLQVAEHNLRNNQLQQAAAVFQKTLELDPENSSLQSRLAELYVKIGRAADARDLYFRNAEALRTRGALDLADDALTRVLKLDPNFGPALLIRGQVRFDSGDPEGAIQALEQLPDIDSKPEGLRTLLRANLSLGKLENSEPLARKLLQVFNDPSGISGHGEALMAAGQYEKALGFFSEHASVLLASNQPAFMQSLQGLTARLKSSPKALEQLSVLFQRAGNTGLIVEVTELLAHACVQQGELVRARDLYQKLTQLEPENPQHSQNYRQIAGKLAELAPPPVVEEHYPEPTPIRVPEPETEISSAEDSFAPEDAQPVSQVEQNYPTDIAEQIEAALTDADLFDSYNLLSKAIAPLESLLPKVPNDVRINQRLASLYARSGRLRDAGERCTVLEKIHTVAGFAQDARFYAELGAKYRQQAPPPPAAKATPVPVEHPIPSTQPEPPVLRRAPEPPSAPAPRVTAAAASTPAAESRSHEIDFSSEWEQMLEVEHPHAAPEPPPSVATPFVEHVVEHVEKAPILPPVAHPVPPAIHHAPAPIEPLPEEPPASFHPPQVIQQTPASTSWDDEEEASNPVAELLDEVRFYISQGMSQEAGTALSRCESLAPGHPEVLKLAAQLAHYDIPAGDASDMQDVEFVDEHHPAEAAPEITTVDPLLISTSAEEVEIEQEPVAPPVHFETPHHEAPRFEPPQPPPPPVPAPRIEPVFHAAVMPPSHPEPVVAPPPPPPVVVKQEPVVVHEPEVPPPPQVYEQPAYAVVEPSPAVVAPIVPSIAPHAPVAPAPVVAASVAAEPVAPVSPVPVVQPVTAPAPVPVVKIHAPVAPPIAPHRAVEAAPVPPPPPVVAPPPKPASMLDMFVQDLESSLGDFKLEPPSPESESRRQVAVQEPAPVPQQAPQHETTIHEPPTQSIAAQHISQDEQRETLNDIFAEFKESMESEADSKEDPETHYNLGVAFKEMDLYDEAIGEFQKVCQAIERGHAFSQTVQAYTWLADCFLKKGVPDLAIRWYERALKTANVDYETDTAIRYELACACDAAGDKQAALGHFMEVYGTNIDYRDVAERIKSLRS